MQLFLRKLLEGKYGLPGWLLRLLLLPLGILYGIAGKIRVALYLRGTFIRHRPSVPVISVGNITAGGTGKTPLVRILAEALLEHGCRPAILMRGYGADNPYESDEAAEYLRTLPGVEVYPNPNRIASSLEAVDEGAEALLLDDGFQHLKLKRDLDIVLMDTICPYGGGWPLPAGLLREFSSALSRADVICLTRADQAGTDRVTKLKARLTTKFPHIPVFAARHEPLVFVNADGEESGLNLFKSKKIVAACGIGNPESFYKTLSNLVTEIVATKSFPDHHAFTKNDISSMLAAAKNGENIIMTMKDAVKVMPLLSEVEKKRFFALRVEMRFEDESALRQILAKLPGLS